MNKNAEADRLYKLRMELRLVAKDAAKRLDWQTQLSTLQQLVDIAPTLWPLMRDRRVKPTGEPAVSVLALAYTVLQDEDRLRKLGRIVDSVPELRERYALEISDCQKKLPLLREIYSQIEANPGVEQSTLAFPHLIYLAACYGVVDRQKQSYSYSLTYQGAPNFEPGENLIPIEQVRR